MTNPTLDDFIKKYDKHLSVQVGIGRHLLSDILARKICPSIIMVPKYPTIHELILLHHSTLDFSSICGICIHCTNGEWLTEKISIYNYTFENTETIRAQRFVMLSQYGHDMFISTFNLTIPYLEFKLRTNM